MEDLRKRIDEIDEKLLDLLRDRAEIAIEIGKKKKEMDLSEFAPSREEQKMGKLLAGDYSPLGEKATRAIFREITSASRALERELTVAYWGPPATFTHMASVQRFGSQAHFAPVPSIDAVFGEVEKGRAHFGVVPIENSTEGVVNHTLDMFLESKLRICSEVFVQVSHNLLSKAEHLSDVKKLYSLAQPLAQCRSWLRAHMADIPIQEVATTGVAAELCQDNPDAGAIGSTFAAEWYDLNVLAERIEDNPRNRTRFLVVGEIKCEPTGRDKTSLMFSVPHKAGALYRALGALETHRVNMTMIESRPTPFTAWEYVFFVDIQGHESGPQVGKALAALRDTALFVSVLGCYPEAR